MEMETTDDIEMIEDEGINANSDDDDGSPSSPESAYEDGQDMMSLGDDVTAQLAAAGPIGVAAAAAIASAKKKKRPHSFETNPSIRKRQQNRLLRKLRQTIFEFATRVGQQAIVLVATPGKPNTSYKVFGAKPLEDVVKNLKNIVMEELETALAQQAPPPVQEDPSLFELPPLIIDGIPTPVEKMTQAQLRAFIPLMLKYSTGRGKPGWGRDSTRPQWWPRELPWANVRMDARTEDEKQKISWTHALRKIVINCYKYHGREDLLPAFSEEDEKANALATSNASVISPNVGVLKIHSSGTVVTSTSQANNSSNSNTISITTTTKGSSQAQQQQATIQASQQQHQQQIQVQTTQQPQTQTIQIQQSPTQTIANAQVCLDSMQLTDVDYTQNMLHTITNADGSLSIIHMDPNNSIITLPDGTTAQVQGVALTTQGEGGTTVHTVQGIDANGHTENMTVDLSEATIGQENQLIITGEDGQGYPLSVSGMITVPVSSMYQMVANIQHLHQNGDGTVCLTPIQVPSGANQSKIFFRAPANCQQLSNLKGTDGANLNVIQLQLKSNLGQNNGGVSVLQLGQALSQSAASSFVDEDKSSNRFGQNNDCNNNDEHRSQNAELDGVCFGESNSLSDSDYQKEAKKRGFVNSKKAVQCLEQQNSAKKSRA